MKTTDTGIQAQGCEKRPVKNIVHNTHRHLLSVEGLNPFLGFSTPRRDQMFANGGRTISTPGAYETAAGTSILGTPNYPQRPDHVFDPLLTSAEGNK